MSAPEVHDPLFELDPAALRCPHETFHRIRAEAPVAWSDRLQCFLVTRYEDIVDVQRDHAVWSSATSSGPSSATPLARRTAEDPNQPDEVRRLAQRRVDIARSVVLLNADPPVHSRQRRLVNDTFRMRRVRTLEPAIVAIANELVDGFDASGDVELNGQFAVPLPLTVIATALAVPLDDLPMFKRWSDAFVVANANPSMTDDDIVQMLVSMNEFYDYFDARIRAVDGDPPDDLFGDIVRAGRAPDEPLSHDEMLQMCANFLVAGNETTAKLITNAVLRLTQDEPLQERVRADPSLLPALVEEVLRIDAPVQGLFRMAKVDTELGGVAIPQGSHVFVLYGAGNRDPAAFPEPDDFRLGRPAAPAHLAFGFGEHFCLGATLARAEARIGLEVLLSRSRTIRLAVEPDELTYEPSVGFHGLRQLPLRLVDMVGAA